MMMVVIKNGGIKSLTFVSYQVELKEIWRNNVAATKSSVLSDEEADISDSIAVCIRNSHNCKGYVITGLYKIVCVCYCHNHQFITKIAEWNSISCRTKRTNKIRGS
jgi:hypothetical protein